MALMLWAKSAAGTNLSFIQGFTKAVKSWREILQQTVLRKPPKTQPQLQRVDVLPRDKLYLQQFDSYQPKSSSSLTSRLFRSLIASSTTRLLSRDLVRRSTLFSRGRSRNIPIFALIGITLGFDVDNLMESSNQNTILGIKNSFERYTWVPETLQKAPQCLDDMHINTEHFLASGCEGVVYEAKVKADSESQVEHPENYDLALKAVFNYGAESNASSIYGGLGREMIPLQCSADIVMEDCEAEIPKPSTHLPPHPNIVEMPSVFIDNVLVTEEGLRTFPAALPHRSDPSQCFGRNKTMYLVMKRTTNNLRTYLAENPDLSMATRCFLLAQLLEGVSHLAANGIAHRDLKSDNLLVDLPGSSASPRLEICDFGCCLAEKDKKMRIQFPSLDLFRGGNDWLMAPEIRNAVPGPEKYLDFEKSDLWAVGAIAYEILGAHNPFYPSPENPSRRLRNTTYDEEDLPSLPDDVPDPIKQLVRSLLGRDPTKRPSAGVAATVAQMVVLSLGKNGSTQMRKRLSSNTAKPRRMVHRGQTGCQRFLPLTTEELLFQKIWIQSLALYSYLTLKTKAPERQNMETVNSFVFLTRLTYAEFRAALTFF